MMMNMAHDEDGNNEVCGSGYVFLWMVTQRCSKKGDLIVSVKQATVSLCSWTVINSIYLRVKAYTSRGYPRIYSRCASPKRLLLAKRVIIGQAGEITGAARPD